MVLRIRLGKGHRIVRKRGGKRRVALTVAALLTPSAAVAGILALWCIAAGLDWTNSFAISEGLFSHWQVWLGAAIVLQLCSHFLNRYGRGGDAATS